MYTGKKKGKRKEENKVLHGRWFWLGWHKKNCPKKIGQSIEK